MKKSDRTKLLILSTVNERCTKGFINCLYLICCCRLRWAQSICC